MRPYFSIIIPLYNKELYIKNTLNSVLNQTFQDFEIIVINDGSTDNSLEIAQKTLSNFNNATFINQKNKGLSIARNKGIANSKGLIIALLDADDIWHKDKIKNQINELIKDEIQEMINEYVDTKESTQESGLGFVSTDDEKELKLSVSENEINKIIKEYKKIKKSQRSNLSQVRKLGLLDKHGRPLK